MGHDEENTQGRLGVFRTSNHSEDANVPFFDFILVVLLNLFFPKALL